MTYKMNLSGEIANEFYVTSNYRNLQSAHENSPSSQSQSSEKVSKPRRKVAKTVQKVGNETVNMSKNFHAISTKKVNQMTRTLEEKKTVISTLNIELLECRNNYESLNVEFRNNVERLNDQVRDNAKLRSEYESLENENRKLHDLSVSRNESLENESRKVHELRARI